jgi:hypothetical protein
MEIHAEQYQSTIKGANTIMKQNSVKLIHQIVIAAAQVS